MGDRANIIVEDGDSTVFLYTHWFGSEAASMLQRALDRGRERWTDGSYLTRIIFCEMVRGHEDELTGFGISSTGIFASREILVNVRKQTVELEHMKFESFDDYVAADPKLLRDPEDEEEAEEEPEDPAELAAKEAKALEEAARRERDPASVTKDEVLAAVQPFQFNDLLRPDLWEDDGADLSRAVSRLSKLLSSAPPPVKLSGEERFDFRLTESEALYVSHFYRSWWNCPMSEALTEDGWCLARIHRELANMLKALVALAPAALEHDLAATPTDMAYSIMRGGDPLETRERALREWQANTREGSFLRLGIYLGIWARARLEAIEADHVCDEMLDELGAVVLPAVPAMVASPTTERVPA